MASLLADRSFERILLIKPTALGDVVHTIPVLVKLRRRYPDARIDWMLTPATAELVGRHPAISNIVLFDRRRLGQIAKPGQAIGGIWRLARQLRRARYDLVIDLHGQLRSAFFAMCTGSRVRVGFDRPRRVNRVAERTLPATAYRHGWTGAREGSWLAYTHRIPVPTLEVHAVDRYQRLGALLGFDAGPLDFGFPLAAEAPAAADALLAEHGLTDRPYAVLAPGTIWETKRWRTEGFAEVAQHFLDRGWGALLVGSPGERERCREVAALCPGATDVSGRTSISVLAALIRRAAIAITNDSGPMHLTVAMGRPVVSIFGPTDDVWIGPYRRENAVARVSLPCAPCYFRRLSQCPHDHRCMREVTAEHVIRLVEEVLADAAACCPSASDSTVS
ncbi:MAG TPA: glycosyltransferase family 9 protein [Phycisphaerae bacterium]|nr:glycosyltransferase family 9 protein [Phycisphaerales bacterium]HRX84327.1 glycosyltransferase family 9 protein [Phycisphaerae bacterium]